MRSGRRSVSRFPCANAWRPRAPSDARAGRIREARRASRPAGEAHRTAPGPSARRNASGASWIVTRLPRPVREAAPQGVPGLTAEARARPAARGTGGLGPFNTIEDFSLWDRCITRGVAGSWLPVVYGNGTRIMQTHDSIIIAHEMVHETRVIPLDRRPHLGGGIRQLMGDPRGHWEGNTLVIETTNFTDRLPAPGGGGARHSEAMKMTERITRIDPEMIDYELRVDDPKTYLAPWTLRMTLTQQPGYEMYEYGCHEGNRSVANSLSGERAYEREAAENARKGLPPPERVFEKVNGEDRGR